MKKNIFTKEEIIKFPYLNFFSYQQIKGSHSFRYHRNGIQKNICCKDLAKAKLKVIEFCSKLQQNNGLLEKNKIVSLCDYGQEWLDIVKKPNVHKDTYRVYKGVFKNYILPYFNDKTFDDITFFDLQKFFNDLPKEKGKTIETIHIVLKGIYDCAFNDDIIKKNILERVKVKKHIRKNGVCLSTQAEKDFTCKIKGNKKELSLLVMLYTGVRPSELSSMIFNWEENTITIKNGKLKDFQTDYYRTIPIFPKLIPLKKRLQTENWKINSKTLSARFPKLCPNYRLYDLRHTFVTRAKECGVCDEVVSLWTGHSLGKTVTAKVYTHYNLDFQQKEALKIVYNLEENTNSPKSLPNFENE